MEVAEIVVYILVAVVVGSLVLFMLRGFDYAAVNETLSNEEDENQEFASLSTDEFYGDLITSIDKCKESGEFTKTVFVDESDEISKESFFVLVKRASLCKDIQSTEYSCGEREDVETFTFQGPKVVTVSCEEETLKIE